MQFHEKYPDNNDEKLGGFQTFRMDNRCLFFPLSIPIKMYFCSGEFRRVEGTCEKQILAIAATY